MRRLEVLQRVNWWPYLVTVALGLVGLTFVHSATLDRPAVQDQHFKQALFLGSSLALCVILLLPHYRRVQRAAWPLYVLSLLSLLGLRWLAPVINGARRWYSLPGLSLQPSEFAKLAVVIALASLLRFEPQGRGPQGLARPLAVAAAPAVLILLQPDLGSALVLLPIALGMCYVAGVPGRAILKVTGLLLVTGIVAYFTFLHGYQQERIDVWLQHFGWSDADVQRDEHVRRLLRGPGYQPWQALIAMGGGGLLGFGLTQGPQNRHDFLPYRSEDYVFAVIGEETGFLGCAFVLLLHAALVVGILAIAWRTRERFGRLLCVGVATWIGGQALVHAAVCGWMVPATGLPMPLVSYGGSSTLATVLGIALCLNVSARREPVLAGDGFR